MRAQATLILGQFLGQTLTPELASRIVAMFPLGGRAFDLTEFREVKCGRLTFAAERGARILPELEALHHEHWKETEGYHRGIPMNPDVAACLLDEAEGRLLQLTARDGGRLVGNFRMYVAPSRHTSQRIATEDTLYLLPEYRKGRNAMRFIEYMESCMRVLHVTEIYLDDKVANPAVGKLLDHLGYEHIANRRIKHLTDTEAAHVRT
jgi:hypothetical protein